MTLRKKWPLISQMLLVSNTDRRPQLPQPDSFATERNFDLLEAIISGEGVDKSPGHNQNQSFVAGM